MKSSSKEIGIIREKVCRLPCMGSGNQDEMSMMIDWCHRRSKSSQWLVIPANPSVQP
jgi:hypothetical protein